MLRLSWELRFITCCIVSTTQDYHSPPSHTLSTNRTTIVVQLINWFCQTRCSICTGSGNQTPVLDSIGVKVSSRLIDITLFSSYLLLPINFFFYLLRSLYGWKERINFGLQTCQSAELRFNPQYSRRSCCNGLSVGRWTRTNTMWTRPVSLCYHRFQASLNLSL